MNIKAYDIFLGKNLHIRKVDYLISNLTSKAPTKRLPLALSYDSKFMTQTKVKKRNKSKALNLKDFVTKYLSTYFHLDTLGMRPVSIGIFLS